MNGAFPTRARPYTWLVSNVLFPMHEWVKRHASVRVRRALEQSQWWTPEQLRALQLSRLRALLAHAQAHVPYYRDLFRASGLAADQFDSVSDLDRLPFLTKAIIRANTERLKSDRAIDLARFNTGGSTGEPLVFFISGERVRHDVAAKWRATRWWGVDIGDPEMVVWGSPVELSAQDRARAVRDKLLRTELLPAFDMSEERLDGFVERIRARPPLMLFGYPSSLALIACHAQRRKVRLDDKGIRVAFVTSERLYEHQREQISGTFGCRVANGYGGRDAGFIAHECPEGGMHITAEDVVVEIIDRDGKQARAGVEGEIVVTHLATRDFPFIRYRTGDIAALGDRQCPCGRGLPLLDEIQGRTTDFVVAADGTVMHGLAVVYPIRELAEVQAFKVIQESIQCTRVQIVPGGGYGPEIEARIRSGLKARLGQSVEVLVETLPRIPAEKSGKYRYVVSRVAL